MTLSPPKCLGHFKNPSTLRNFKISILEFLKNKSKVQLSHICYHTWSSIWGEWPWFKQKTREREKEWNCLRLNIT